MLAKIGPGLNSNSRSSWLNALTPVMSLGSRSGVNWTRRTEQSMDLAKALASCVLPDAWHVLDQDVPLGQQHGEGKADRAWLAGDDGLHRDAHLPGDLDEFIQRSISLLVGVRDHVPSWRPLPN